MLREVVRLVLPLECAGCGRPDVVLCPACTALVAGPPRRVDADAPRLDLAGREDRLPVWAFADYCGPVREAVVSWKDRGRADLDPVLTAALRAGVRELVPTVRLAAGPATELLVVPVPSSPLASLRRGRSPVGVLAGAVVDGLRSAGARARLCTALVGRASARAQVGLGQRARQRNVSGRIAVRGARLARAVGREHRDGLWCCRSGRARDSLAASQFTGGSQQDGCARGPVRSATDDRGEVIDTRGPGGPPPLIHAGRPERRPTTHVEAQNGDCHRRTAH